MDILKFNLVSAENNPLKTELLFHIAEAHAKNREVLCCVCPSESILKKSFGILRELKKNKTVTLYVPATEITSESTEAQYMLNKYPEVETYTTDGYSVWIKI